MQLFKKREECLFCKVTRYALVFALGVVFGIAWVTISDAMPALISDL